MFGVDCLALGNGQDHLDCVALATGEQGRYVVSRGTAAARISKRLPPGHTLAIITNELELQVEEVFRYFNISVDSSSLFSRCVLCNGSQYYELPQDLLISLADNIREGEEVKERESSVTVKVTSQSGDERQGQVDMLTGQTDTGVLIQVTGLGAALGQYSSP